MNEIVNEAKLSTTIGPFFHSIQNDRSSRSNVCEGVCSSIFERQQQWPKEKEKRAETEYGMNLKAIHKWMTVAIAIATYAYLNAEL